jgi:hypothetical protein
MKLINKIKTIGIAIISLGMLLTMPITFSLATPPFTAQASMDKEKNFVTIAKGRYCQWDNETYMVIRDKETWEKVWVTADIQRTAETRDKNRYSEYQNSPKIDFNKEMVIAAFMGMCPSSAFSIEISKIVENTVYIIRHVPSYLTNIPFYMKTHLKTINTPAFIPSNTCPYHLVRAPLLTEKLEFHVTTVVSNPLYH